MKTTELMFRFPIVVYDGIEMAKREKKEYESEIPVNGVMEYAIGYTAVPIDEIKAWCDMWRKGVQIGDIKAKIKEGKRGFDSTCVMTESLGDFHCSWAMDKFELKYNEHIEKLESYYEEMALQAALELEAAKELASNSINGEIKEK